MKLKTAIPATVFLLLGLACATPTGEDGSTVTNSDGSQASSETTSSSGSESTSEGGAEADANTLCRKELAQHNCAIKAGNEGDFESPQSNMLAWLKQNSTLFHGALGDEAKCAEAKQTAQDYLDLVFGFRENIDTYEKMIEQFDCVDADVSTVPAQTAFRDLSFDEIRAIYVCNGTDTKNLDEIPENQREGAARNLQASTHMIVTQTGCTPEGIKLER